jgi:hypothetical protein
MKTIRRRVEWRELVKLLDEPGATLKAVAAAHGVNVRTLSWWRTQFRREAVPKPTKPRSEEPAVAAAPRFARVAPHPPAPVPKAPGLVLEVGAVRIDVSRAFDPSLLAQVLEVLGVRGAR